MRLVFVKRQRGKHQLYMKYILAKLRLHYVFENARTFKLITILIPDVPSFRLVPLKYVWCGVCVWYPLPATIIGNTTELAVDYEGGIECSRQGNVVGDANQSLYLLLL